MMPHLILNSSAQPATRIPQRLRRLVFTGSILLLALASSLAFGEGILGSKHDLSIAGPGPIRSTAESEVCLFCHTPHRATSQTPLWNHRMSEASYTIYSSSTTKANIGQPTGSSKLCLSCHDGTVALGMVNTRATPIEMQGGITTMPTGPSNLGTDLADDHPVSFIYDNALVSAKGDLKDPASLREKVRLDHNGQVQCTSCHDPHDNKFGKFMVQDNYASALCLNCHDPRYWRDSSHRLSNKQWSGNGIDPWPNSERTSVSANACENCHAPHSAGTKQRLLTFADEERNCFSCHSGNVAAKNIESEFNKFSTHPILATSRLHDPMEDPVNSPRHVECQDCHNPHATKATTATAPLASGALAGVRGINAAGTVVEPLTMEYELCYRCHADSVSRGPAKVPRQFPETNTRIEFKPANASYHPVQTAGKNAFVPSLIPPWSPSSRMYCTDCHNSDQSPATGGNGPNGPHGSIYPPLLERQLLLQDHNPETAGAYALCYKCHNRSSILANESFPSHRKHIEEYRAACTTCHDPHGVESKPHLINFNTDYVTPSLNGRLEYNSTGNRMGNCSLTCHGSDHSIKAYSP
ncbi:MAG TPA: cytochrome c3 family protein [Clostridia bacterium]|nr:cytochrome c3 family protein [Clostridia bacterium]